MQTSKRTQGHKSTSDMCTYALMTCALMLTGCARRLLEDGANPNAHPIGYDPPLILAIRRGHSNVAKLLIDNGANVNLKGQDERTALMYAAERGDTEIVNELVSNGGCDTVEAVDQQHGYTATMFAHAKKRPKIVTLLTKKCNALAPHDDVYVTQHGSHYHKARCFYVEGSAAKKRALEPALGERLLPCNFCLRQQ